MSQSNLEQGKFVNKQKVNNKLQEQRRFLKHKGMERVSNHTVIVLVDVLGNKKIELPSNKKEAYERIKSYDKWNQINGIVEIYIGLKDYCEYRESDDEEPSLARYRAINESALLWYCTNQDYINICLLDKV